MDTLTIAICDDEDASRQELQALLKASGYTCTCICFENGEELLSSFTPSRYDIVFLDIYMGGMSGVDAAERIRRLDPDIPIAFTTTSPDHALDGYRHHVDRYLLKPYRDDEIREALDYAAKRLGERADATVNVAGDTIPTARICYVEQRNHTLIIYLVDGEQVKHTGKLDDLERNLPSPPFYRCHKGFLVNLDYAKRVNRDLNVFEMEGGGNAYIRKASVREAQRAFEQRIIERTRSL